MDDRDAVKKWGKMKNNASPMWPTFGVGYSPCSLMVYCVSAIE